MAASSASSDLLVVSFFRPQSSQGGLTAVHGGWVPQAQDGLSWSSITNLLRTDRHVPILAAIESASQQIDAPDTSGPSSTASSRRSGSRLTSLFSLLHVTGLKTGATLLRFVDCLCHPVNIHQAAKFTD